MTQMLLTFQGRAHDLPPKWDGRVVKWSAWESNPIVMCGPRGVVGESPCEGCQATASRATSRGTVYPGAGETYESEQPRVKRTRSGKEYAAGVEVVTMRAKPKVQLVAFRCPDCGLDGVFDLVSDECWILDESDYGVNGSTS